MLAWAACSSPPAPTSDHAAGATPARDAGANETMARSPTDASGGEVDGYRFAWQQLRDEYAAFRKSPIGSDSCDFRRHDYRQSVICPGPHEIAGLVLRAGGGRKPGTEGIVIDRGSRDMITRDWTAAVLDDQGHPITPWAPVEDLIDDDRAYAEVEAARADDVRNHHVGLRVDQRMLEAKLKREGRFH